MSFSKTGPTAPGIRQNWRILCILLIICWLIIGGPGSSDRVRARYVIQDRIAFQVTIAGMSG